MDRSGRRFFQKQIRKQRSAIGKTMAKLRARAEKNRGATVRELTAGWSFVLSVGALLPQGEPDTFFETVGQILGVGDKPPPEQNCDHDHWHFSAKLHPWGRDSTTEDWHTLGKAQVAVGVPEEVCLAGEWQIRADSELTLHFPWTEPKAHSDVKTA